LVTGYLEDAEPGDIARMNPFNLITAGPDGGHLLSNFPGHDRRVLTSGVHTLSNGGLDELWFKEVRLATALEAWLGAETQPEALFEALHDPVPDPQDTESPFSAVFIVNPDYGTRCSTVVAVDRDGRGVIIERSFGADGAVTGTERLEFAWP
jgi:uncharacterized protein with NRDE domain